MDAYLVHGDIHAHNVGLRREALRRLDAVLLDRLRHDPATAQGAAQRIRVDAGQGSTTVDAERDAWCAAKCLYEQMRHFPAKRLVKCLRDLCKQLDSFSERTTRQHDDRLHIEQIIDTEAAPSAPAAAAATADTNTEDVMLRIHAKEVVWDFTLARMERIKLLSKRAGKYDDEDLGPPMERRRPEMKVDPELKLMGGGDVAEEEVSPPPMRHEEVDDGWGDFGCDEEDGPAGGPQEQHQQLQGELLPLSRSLLPSPRQWPTRLRPPGLHRGLPRPLSPQGEYPLRPMQQGWVSPLSTPLSTPPLNPPLVSPPHPRDASPPGAPTLRDTTQPPHAPPAPLHDTALEDQQQQKQQQQLRGGVEQQQQQPLHTQ
ncbi:unnamed protein product [Vitrella brassicaformis CCMP3155]|uniref:Uncharacterized protein n=1 Tax=Vitrella brassicaformis (strain CCMP3155) TaxID=1169540 RepID=A0A0G4H1V7_VITBC|nr:unnamed protein product [Vitrella brassicaformis CCMP3155]|eukprot:CEM37605.1 unnamed protein product [Vitrella brassicaformis CCMP3155]